MEKQTQAEQLAGLEKQKAEKKAAIDKRIEAELEAGFLNPFGEGVSYELFLKSIPKGKSVKEYLTGKLISDTVTKEQENELISWIEKDLSFYAPYKTFLKELEKPKK